MLRAAFGELDRKGLKLKATSPILATAPIGPSLRRFANAAALVKTRLEPEELLARLKKIERRFGRRPRARCWAARVLDLDVILWSGGVWASPDLIVPHREYRKRRFVLAPAAAIASGWRDPITGLSPRHLLARLDKATRPYKISRPKRS